MAGELWALNQSRRWMGDGNAVSVQYWWVADKLSRRELASVRSQLCHATVPPVSHLVWRLFLYRSVEPLSQTCQTTVMAVSYHSHGHGILQSPLCNSTMMAVSHPKHICVTSQSRPLVTVQWSVQSMSQPCQTTVTPESRPCHSTIWVCHQRDTYLHVC